MQDRYALSSISSKVTPLSLFFSHFFFLQNLFVVLSLCLLLCGCRYFILDGLTSNDCHLGRIAAGLRMIDINFAVLPPHFVDVEALPSAFELKAIFPAYDKYPDSFKVVCPYLVASLVFVSTVHVVWIHSLHAHFHRVPAPGLPANHVSPAPSHVGQRSLATRFPFKICTICGDGHDDERQEPAVCIWRTKSRSQRPQDGNYAATSSRHRRRNQE